MFDANRILGQLMGSPTAKGFAGGVAGGVATNMLMGRTGKKMRKKVLKYGALAAVGGLAYVAYRNWQQKKEGATAAATASPVPAPAVEDLPPPGSKFLPAETDTKRNAELGLTLVRAMISAARADGKLDAEETQAIFGKMDALELSPDDRATLMNELGKPVDLDTLVAAADSPEVASEIYVASRLAIEVDSPAERAYLQMLAARLELDDGLVAELEKQLEAA